MDSCVYQHPTEVTVLYVIGTFIDTSSCLHSQLDPPCPLTVFLLVPGQLTPVPRGSLSRESPLASRSPSDPLGLQAPDFLCLLYPCLLLSQALTWDSQPRVQGQPLPSGPPPSRTCRHQHLSLQPGDFGSAPGRVALGKSFPLRFMNLRRVDEVSHLRDHSESEVCSWPRRKPLV